MSVPDKFTGWVADDASAAKGKMVWKEFTPKKWEENDVDIKVTHSGVCFTDLDFLGSTFGPSLYPMVAGHEIVGEIVRVGTAMQDKFKVGDLVGVPGMADTCLERDGESCSACHDGHENICPKYITSFGGHHRNGDQAFGGFAQHHRAKGDFVYKIPSGVAPEDAAPLMCAGGTAYSPLKKHGAGPGKKVAVVGVGGVGHAAVIFARAMDCDLVVGLSRKEEKRAEVLEMGAHDYIATDDEKDWVAKHEGQFDLILNTVTSSKAPFNDYMKLLKKGGTLVMLGVPDQPVSIDFMPLLWSEKHIASSLGASRATFEEMLQVAADKKIKLWVQTRPMKDANQALMDQEAGKARYRYVLTT